MKKIFIVLLLFIQYFYIYTQDQTDDVIKDENVNTNEDIDSNENTNITVQPEKKETQEIPRNGWDLYLNKRYSESIYLLKDEMRRFPDRINIYVILGWDYKELKRYKEMEEISSAGLKINSLDIRLVKNLGESYFFQNEYFKAIKELEKYISYKYNSNDSFIATAYYYIGICFYNLQSYRKADIALSTSRFYQPNNYKLLHLLGKTKIELKEYEKARKYLNDTLKINPNNNEVIEDLKRIKDFQ